ncbi:hypothetical protein BCR34DRAFT_492426 [Clohesyomyces aquaticus]|uniref:ABM domain-containing protein n=1 Tax=Clohesyomyces aquaticus TaxID=1231657 RepID=A0A1Y1YZP0_9PLEO|nr:hypothetical protein BCR34DRAFT_492426 [Clohesyomyces aquaticus]
MPKQATEICIVPVVAGLDLTSGESKKIWHDGLKTITSVPGCLSLFWGRQIEHPDVVDMIIEWESIDKHQDFMKSPSYAPFLESLTSLMAGAPTIYHAEMGTELPFSGPGSAPVTECLSLYFEESYAVSDFDSSFAKAREGMEKTAEEAQGLASGWVVEDVKHKGLGPEGAEGPGKMFWAVVGWPSVEAHMKYRGSEDFAKVIPYLREGPKGVEVHHVAFQKFQG